MAGKSGSRKPRKTKKECKSLDLDVAHWMIPQSISVKKDSTCNVLVIVPYGYPEEDDNVELLGAWLAEMLGSFAVINYRLYHRRSTKGLAGNKGDLGSSAFAEKVPKFMDSIIACLQAIKGHVRIVLILHGIADDISDDFALGKGYVGRGSENSRTCVAGEFAVEFLAGLKQLGTANDNHEEYQLPNTLSIGLFREYGAQVFNVSVRCEGYRDSTERLRQTCLGLVKVMKELSIFEHFPDGREIRIDAKGNCVSQDSEIPTDNVYVSPTGQEYEVFGNYKPSEPVKGPSIRDKVNFLRGQQAPNVETQIGRTKEADMVDDKAVEVETGNQNQDCDSNAVIGGEQLGTMVARIKKQTQIRNDKRELIPFSGDVRDTFVADVQKSYPVVKAMVTNIFDTGKFFHEVKERQKKNGLWIAFTDTIGLSRRTAHNYIQAYERLGTSMGDYSYLGVTKLLTVTRVKEPVAYLEKHADAIAQESTVQVRQRVAQETKRNTSGQKRRKPTKRVEEMGYQDVKAELASNGRVLKLSGLNKELGEEILELVKSHFSQKK